ncbi:hypothetical protein ABZ942_35330 [Nocardia sp. NPDC046473]|uniref:hypothetical protein n=1 Tax=Nocardia sp. NPDC046473 TaxID=3155733 RepID=UPI0033CE05C0
MADDPPKIDDTTKATYDDWEKNRDNANNGRLGINGLKFDIKATVECVSRCHDMIENLTWYQDFIKENHMNDMEVWSNENGGMALTRRFNTKGNDIIATMDTMKRILEDMGDTFRSAGGGYLRTDKKNSDDLAKLNQVGDLQAALTNKTPPKGDPAKITTMSSLSDKPNPLKPAAGAGNEKGIDVENADLWTYDKYYYFGESLKKHDQLAYDVGTRYTWMSGNLSRDLADLNAALKRVNSEMWTGEGADQAVKAIGRFTDNSDSFAKALQNLGSDLLYCAQWLNYMRQDIPSLPWDNDRSEYCYKMKKLGDWRERYKSAYMPGIENAVKAMPMVAVTGAAPTPPPGGNNNGGNNNGGNNNGGNNNGGNNNSGNNNSGNNNSGNNNSGSNNGGNDGSNNGGNNNVDKNSPEYKVGYQDGLNQRKKDAGGGNNAGGNNGGGSNSGNGNIDKNSPNYKGGFQDGYNQGKSGASGDGSNNGGSQGGDGSKGTGGSNPPNSPKVNSPGGGDQGGGDNSGGGNNGGDGSNNSNYPQTNPASYQPLKPTPLPGNKPGQQTPPKSPQDLINKLMHGENPFKDLSPDALQKIGKDLLGGLNPDLLKNMSPEALQKLGSDLLQHMSPEDLKKFGNDLLGGLGPDGLKGLDPDTLSKLDPEMLRKLSPETLSNLGQTLAQTPGGTDLVKTLVDGFKGVTSALTDVVKTGTQVLAGLAPNGMVGIPGLGDLQSLDIPGFDSSAIPKDIAAALGGPGPGHAGIPGDGGGAPHTPLSAHANVGSKLFPRASAPGGFDNAQIQAMQAGGTGPAGSGMPMGPGPGPGAQGGAGNEYKRPKYLDAAVYLDGLLGEGLEQSKPVIEP